MTRSSDDPEVASYARQRLEVAWRMWETMAVPAFYDPAVIVALDERIRAGIAWLAVHRGQPDYNKGQRLLNKLRAERSTGCHELARWQQAEAAYLEAERDYLGIVGRPVLESEEKDAGDAATLAG